MGNDQEPHCAPTSYRSLHKHTHTQTRTIIFFHENPPRNMETFAPPLERVIALGREHGKALRSLWKAGSLAIIQNNPHGMENAAVKALTCGWIRSRRTDPARVQSVFNHSWKVNYPLRLSSPGCSGLITGWGSLTPDLGSPRCGISDTRPGISSQGGFDEDDPSLGWQRPPGAAAAGTASSWGCSHVPKPLLTQL